MNKMLLIIGLGVLGTTLYALYWLIKLLGFFNLVVYCFIGVTTLLLINYTFVILLKART